jgi:probable phosphoglycerate mutase
VDGDIAIIGHGHLLRALAGALLGLPVADGALFRLDVGTISLLGHEHDRPGHRAIGT